MGELEKLTGVLENYVKEFEGGYNHDGKIRLYRSKPFHFADIRSTLERLDWERSELLERRDALLEKIARLSKIKAAQRQKFMAAVRDGNERRGYANYASNRHGI